MPQSPPDDLLREAAELDAEAADLIERAAGKKRRAVLLRELAREQTAPLPPSQSSSNLRNMTSEQLRRRGSAIAKGKAAKSKDPLLIAISKSRWGSQEVYARQRLAIAPGTLTGYRQGLNPAPRPVADAVKRDFEIGHDYWPSGVVD